MSSYKDILKQLLVTSSSRAPTTEHINVPMTHYSSELATPEDTPDSVRETGNYYPIPLNSYHIKGFNDDIEYSLDTLSSSPETITSTAHQEYARFFTSSYSETSKFPDYYSLDQLYLTRKSSAIAIPFELYGWANTHTTDQLYMKTFNVLAPEDQIYPSTRERIRRRHDYQLILDKDIRQRRDTYLTCLRKESNEFEKYRNRIKEYRQVNASDDVAKKVNKFRKPSSYESRVFVERYSGR